MSGREDRRRKARSDFVNRKMTQAIIATVHGVSEATVGRWKKAAKEDGDDWDLARAANAIAGAGSEVVISSVLEDYFILAQEVMVEVRNSGLSPVEKVEALVKLADATVKMSSSMKRLAPNISELGVAQDVVAKILEFVREEYPQHSMIMLEVLEAFSETLTSTYTP